MSRRHYDQEARPRAAPNVAKERRILRFVIESSNNLKSPRRQTNHSRSILDENYSKRINSTADFFLLDHDQRHTLSTGLLVNLPSRAFTSTTVRYGSGFVDEDHSPNHLPGYTLIDVSFGENFGENWLLAIQAVNVMNRRFLLDNSETFGGTHFVEPRQIYVEVKYRFHY